MRNELTSAEFALNLNGAISAPPPATTAASAGTKGEKTAGVTGTGGASSSSSSGSGSAAVAASPPSAGSVKSEIDYESIAERLEASLRALQAGRPLSLLEAVSQEEVNVVCTFCMDLDLDRSG